MYLNTITNEQGQENLNFFTKIAPKTSPHNTWLNACRNANLPKFASILERVSLSAGDYIYQPEDQVDYIYFPETAVVSEFQILKDGRAVGTSLHGNESIIGLSAIFDAQPATNWTQVLLSGNAYRIKTEVFKTTILHHQKLQMLMFEYINNHVRQLSQKIVCNSYHSIEERLCVLLLTLQDLLKTGIFSITQEQIAYFLGTHRPSVTQIASALRTKKTINYVRRNLTILDRTKLKILACDCYTGI